MSWRTQLPEDPESLRAAIFEGALFHVGPTAASRALVADVRQLLEEAFGAGDPRYARERTTDDVFFASIGRIRKTLFSDVRFHRHVFDVVAAAGLDPNAVAFDPVRLRTVTHRGHENPRAAPLYYVHRDTWFSISQSAIAWWIAVHDTAAATSFEVYPEYFGRAVDNDSERFDYDAFARDPRELKVGWQDEDAGRTVHYCRALGALAPSVIVPLEAAEGDNVLFSAAHLHRTLPHAEGFTRYSLDFRVADVADDAADRGAPNADNRSRGHAIRDWVRIGAAL